MATDWNRGRGLEPRYEVPPTPTVEEKDDPWVHRSTRMKCKSCMWFLLKEHTQDPPSELGRCRRRAPTLNGYPAVFVTDWCGDHKMDEEKR